MRTTIDIDDATLSELKEIARNKGSSLKNVINQALQQAISGSSAPRKPARYTCPTFPMGAPRSENINLDHALALSSDLEDEEIVRKMELRK